MPWQKKSSQRLLRSLPPEIMEEKLYRIEELETTGWTLFNSTDVGMNKEQVTKRYNELLDEGISPSRLRIIREQ